MSIYAIGDLHLSLDNSKPMDVFGDNWENHMEKIKNNWINIVKENDLVIIPGDFSWKMHLKDMHDDFEFINKLPGKKLLTKGNHDYWWTTLKSMNDFIKKNEFSNIDFLLNNSYSFEQYAIIGTRGWNFKEDDELDKMQTRELHRLENSILDCVNKYPEKTVICALHYPPITKAMVDENIKSPYLELLKKYNIKYCIYGHLHGDKHQEAVENEIDGIKLKLVSSDYLNFEPFKLKLGEQTYEENIEE